MPKSFPDSDNPEITDAEFARAMPLAHAPAHVQRAFRRARGKQKAPTKVQISLRVSPDVLARYRRLGRGWQARMDADLAKAAKRLPAR